MALVVADRVKETTTTTGTGAITLAGATTNFVTFSSVLSDGDTTYYAIVDDANTDFEVGLGTYASSGNTLTRTTVLASTNSGSAVNLSAGSKEVFITYPADKSVNRDASGNVSVSGGVTATSFTGNVTGNITGDVTGNVTGAVTATQVDLTGQGDLRLQDSSGGQYVALQAPATVGSSFTLTLPTADGSADQFIKTDGSGNLSFAAAGGGGFQSMQVFTSSGTWTKPAGINTIKVTVTGGGGGGGGTRAYYGEAGGGGGAGGTAIEIIDVSSVSSVTVTVASGGAGGSGASDGSSGGNSSFGTYCYGNAGSGGLNHGTANGGIGGGASGGDINIPGGGGSHGVNNNTNQTGQGQGGASYWGGAYRTQEDTNANGGDGEAYGSGGGGAVNRTNYGADLTGGAGKGGIVVVEEFA